MKQRNHRNYRVFIYRTLSNFTTIKNTFLFVENFDVFERKC